MWGLSALRRLRWCWWLNPSTSTSTDEGRWSSDDNNVSADGDELLVFVLPVDPREFLLVEDDIARDDVLVGLGIVAVESLVAVFKSHVNALLTLPASFVTILLVDMNVSATAKGAQHAEVWFFSP